MIKDIDLITQLLMSQGMREVHIEIVDKDGNHSKFDYHAHQSTPIKPERVTHVKDQIGEHNV